MSKAEAREMLKPHAKPLPRRPSPGGPTLARPECGFASRIPSHGGASGATAGFSAAKGTASGGARLDPVPRKRKWGASTRVRTGLPDRDSGQKRNPQGHAPRTHRRALNGVKSDLARRQEAAARRHHRVQCNPQTLPSQSGRKAALLKFRPTPFHAGATGSASKRGSWVT